MCICYVYFRRSIFSFGFSFRHVVSDKGSSSDTCIRVRNLQLGVSTVWSLEKFELKDQEAAAPVRPLVARAQVPLSHGLQGRRDRW